ncbi:hypothetical protein L596_012976 [Steinernema carpocapsae]|uniref:Secreted protein n=1 Tax=Steinernema carpocapsae TaxID=34508 RepID=A0A4U5NYU8_STECR|nr:hypothetical protein L596_012976 [Steinernema carpocapsae]
MSSADASSLTLCCFFRSLALTLRAKLSTPRRTLASTNACHSKTEPPFMPTEAGLGQMPTEVGLGKCKGLPPPC